jgi:CRP/FNR family transcriptional regulator
MARLPDPALFPDLASLSPAALRKLQDNVQFYEVAAKVALVCKGDKVGGAYLVEAGELRVYNITAEGQESTLYWVRAGESCILAMNSVFSDLLYPAWVQSGEHPTRFAVIPGGVFRELFATETSMQRFTFNVMAGRIFELMSLLEEAVSLDVEQRVASLLVRQCDGEGTVRMSQDRMASHLGTAREVITRALKKLTERGLVQTSRGSVKVLDPVTLAATIPE